VLVAIFGVFTTVAWTHATIRPSTENETYGQRVTFSYDATAPAGVTDPTGSVVTGDPVFLRLVHTLDVTAHYALAPTTVGGPSTHATAMSGTIGATAVLQGPGGVERSPDHGGARHLLRPTASVVVPIDLSRIASPTTSLTTKRSPGAIERRTISRKLLDIYDRGMSRSRHRSHTGQTFTRAMCSSG
jgi:hypothetical protein